MATEFSSPKRKRADEVPQIQTSIVPRFPQIHPAEPEAGDESPRAYVAGRFQTLNLEHPDLSQHVGLEIRESKRIAQSSMEPFHGTANQAPHLHEHSKRDPEHPASTRTADTTPSFLEHPNTLAPPRDASKRPKSPSLSGEKSDQYWHESEITGHDPTDPNDDGYGINGIGFKPTPAIAWARSQKRKQQLSDYRSREAREARQKRSERRRGGSGSGETSKTLLDAGDMGKTRVRFEDG
jgi:hypothetical protein